MSIAVSLLEQKTPRHFSQFETDKLTPDSKYGPFFKEHLLGFESFCIVDHLEKRSI